MHLVELADALLWETGLKDDAGLNGALFRSIDRVAADPPGRLAWNLLTHIRGWFRANGQGRRLLWELLLKRVRNARALVHGLKYLEWFDRDEQRELILEWLTGSSSPAIAPARHFVRAAGRHLGWAALVRYEETGQPTGAHDVIDQLIRSPSQSGVLSDSSMHLLFVGQSVFGAKQALANGGVPFERADEFAQRMKTCWEALRSAPVGAEQKDPPAFALWVFHPILDAADEQGRSKLELTDDARQGWWRILKPLATSVAREGPLREVHSLLHCLKHSPLVARVDGAEVLDILVELRSRAETFAPEDGAYHRDDTIACASSVIESVMANTVDAIVRDELYSLVAAWAAPPLGNETAATVAKRLRA